MPRTQTRPSATTAKARAAAKAPSSTTAKARAASAKATSAETAATEAEREELYRKARERFDAERAQHGAIVGTVVTAQPDDEAKK